MAKPTQECPELRKPCLQTHRYEPGEFCNLMQSVINSNWCCFIKWYDEFVFRNIYQLCEPLKCCKSEYQIIPIWCSDNFSIISLTSSSKKIISSKHKSHLALRICATDHPIVAIWCFNIFIKIISPIQSRKQKERKTERKNLAFRICATDHPIVALVNISTPPPNLLVTSEADTPEVGSHGKSTLPTSRHFFMHFCPFFCFPLFSLHVLPACMSQWCSHMKTLWEKIMIKIQFDIKNWDGANKL